MWSVLSVLSRLPALSLRGAGVSFPRPAKVKNASGPLPQCVNHHNNHSCPYNPGRQFACASPGCREERSDAAHSICVTCQAGRRPCTVCFLRRGAPGTPDLCAHCGGASPAASPPPTAPAQSPTALASTPSRCSTPKCGAPAVQESTSRTGAQCPMCIVGVFPCATATCSFRVPRQHGQHCLVCQPPALLHFCRTPACTNVVESPEDTLCCLCTSSCFPCATRRCDGRSTPGSAGLCRTCGLSTPQPLPSLSKRSYEQAERPCSSSGCNGVAQRKSSDGLCIACIQKGKPCSNRAIGCVYRVGPLGTVVECRHCCLAGPPCQGPGKTGCRAPARHGVRRAVPHNNGMCERCLNPRGPSHCATES